MPTLTLTLKQYLEQQTEHYLSDINPEKKNDALTAVVGFFGQFPLLKPLNHLIGEPGRQRAQNYMNKISEMDDDAILQELLKDICSNQSMLSDSTYYVRELQIGLIAFLNKEDAALLSQSIQHAVNKKIRQSSEAIKYIGSASINYLYNKELTQRLQAALQEDHIGLLEKYFPDYEEKVSSQQKIDDQVFKL